MKFDIDPPRRKRPADPFWTGFYYGATLGLIVGLIGAWVLASWRLP